jgi:hypothetical protein
MSPPSSWRDLEFWEWDEEGKGYREVPAEVVNQYGPPVLMDEYSLDDDAPVERPPLSAEGA